MEGEFRARQVAKGTALTAAQVFTFRYFGSVHPSKVGDRWSISAEPQWREQDTPWFESESATALSRRSRGLDYTYIGYDIPKITGGTPSSQRPYRVWVYGKRSVYFDSSEANTAMWPMEWFERARKELVQDYPGFEFIGSIKVENVENSKDQYYIDNYVNKGMKEVPCPEGIRNLGTLLPKAEFERELSQVRIMLGIGNPMTSPSPYFALANGVSFINPVSRFRGCGERRSLTIYSTKEDTIRTGRTTIGSGEGCSIQRCEPSRNRE